MESVLWKRSGRHLISATATTTAAAVEADATTTVHARAAAVPLALLHSRCEGNCDARQEQSGACDLYRLTGRVYSAAAW